jgi:hypothetical protein
MTRRSRGEPSCAMLAAAGLMMVGQVAGMVRAADDPVAQPRGVAESREEAMVVGRLQLHAAPGGRRVTEYDLGRLFDQHVFGRSGAASGVQIMMVRNGVVTPPVEQPPIGLEAGLAAVRRRGAYRIGILEEVCHLDEEQASQLKMALHSDLKRLAYEIDGVRARYADQTIAAIPAGLDRELLARLRSDAEACRRQIERAPDSGSLLVASLPHVLEPAQAEAFAAWLADQRRRRWQAMVASVLAQLDGAGLRLARSQHAALEAMLLDEVPALAVLREPPVAKADTTSTRFQMPLVLARLAARERVWLPVLDSRQQEVLRQRIGRVGGGDPAAVEQLLVHQGILEEVGR